MSCHKALSHAQEWPQKLLSTEPLGGEMAAQRGPALCQGHTILSVGVSIQTQHLHCTHCGQGASQGAWGRVRSGGPCLQHTRYFRGRENQDRVGEGEGPIRRRWNSRERGTPQAERGPGVRGSRKPASFPPGQADPREDPGRLRPGRASGGGGQWGSLAMWKPGRASPRRPPETPSALWAQ